MITITVNGKKVQGQWLSAGDIRREFKENSDIIVVNGFPGDDTTAISDGDLVALIRRGEQPSLDEMKFLMQTRNSPEIYEKLSNKTVAIAGAGGLGSAVAVALARLFVKKLVIADFDVVEPSNLNRQQYFMDQLGHFKVDALEENLRRINPYLEIETINQRVTKENVVEIFSQADIVAECFDVPESKAMLTEAVLTKLRVPLVAVSGIAGHEDVDKLVCRKIGRDFYLIGDGVSAASPGNGLMAPKVGVAAHLQAAKIMEVLLEKDNGC